MCNAKGSDEAQNINSGIETEKTWQSYAIPEPEEYTVALKDAEKFIAEE